MAKEERVDLIKKVYSKTEYPKVIDTKFSELGVTSLTNEIDNTLAWDGGYSESSLTSDLNVDFLSNGFKIRDTDGYYNTSGAEYIFAAWAELPFKYANAF